MALKNFKKAYLKDTLGLPYSNVVQDNIVGQGRWTIEHELIFQDPKDKRYYRCCYSVGATEMQEQSPWEYDENVECMEVWPRFVEKLSYIPVEEKRLASADEVLDFLRDNNLTTEMSDVLGSEAAEDVIHDSSNEEIRRCVANYIDNEIERQRIYEMMLAEKAATAKKGLEKNGVPEKFVEKFIEKLNSHSEKCHMDCKARKKGEGVVMSFHGLCQDFCNNTELDLEAAFKLYKERKASGDKKPMAYIVQMAYAGEFSMEEPSMEI